MDIIAAHQQGLTEKLADEAAALAGRPKDFGQRAVVFHHLYDHSRGNHIWALAEARRELQIAAAIGNLRRRVTRWGWLAARRECARMALEMLEQALGEASRTRFVAAYSAYRLSGAKSLRNEAEVILLPELLQLLICCHTARRSGSAMGADESSRLFDESEALAEGASKAAMLERAWVAIDSTALRRLARKLLGQKALERELTRSRKRGWPKVEQELRRDPALPGSFRANPAQHFYALQNVLAERRRQQWREESDREPDAFELAA